MSLFQSDGDLWFRVGLVWCRVYFSQSHTAGRTDCTGTVATAIVVSVYTHPMEVRSYTTGAVPKVQVHSLSPFTHNDSFSVGLFCIAYSCTVRHSLYALSCVVFAYAEGYKGFHLKFSPLVVKRSFTLTLGTPQGNNPLNYVLAPLFSMGLFGATKKRMIVSWSVSIGVAVIVALVKQLTPVPRCILDAGVVVGLSIGSCSILYYYFRSMFTGTLPTTDACLPSSSATSKKV